jgi:hypothetical protein
MTEEQKLKIARHLASAISPWIYSVDRPPERLNDMFRAWVDFGELPASIEAIDEAAKVIDG